MSVRLLEGMGSKVLVLEGTVRKVPQGVDAELRGRKCVRLTELVVLGKETVFCMEVRKGYLTGPRTRYSI